MFRREQSGIGLRLLLLSVSLLWGAGGCSLPSDTKDGPVGYDNVEEIYAKYKVSIQTQIKEGQSWIRYDDDILSRLAEAVPSHRCFFALEVQRDFFVAEKVLIRSELYAKHRDKLDTLSEDPDRRQAIWLRVLSDGGCHSDHE